MQRLCAKFRSLAFIHSNALSLSSRRLLHSNPLPFSSLRPPLHFTFRNNFSLSPLLNSQLPKVNVSNHTSLLPLSLVQVRHVSSRERKKRRKPMTPVVSKVKKIKIKPYASFKSRFRIMNDGTIRRWKEGKRHNAHLKSKKAKRRLRKAGVVPVAYAKVMKRLNFCG